MSNKQYQPTKCHIKECAFPLLSCNNCMFSNKSSLKVNWSMRDPQKNYQILSKIYHQNRK